MRAEFGRPRPVWEQFGPFITGSWLGFWSWVLAAGVLSGLGLWWIGGWWYRVRLSWLGAADPDERLARLVFVNSSFVFAGPVVAFTMIQTLAYPTYAEAYASEDPAAFLLLVFLLWSLISNYIGVRTLFSVSRWKARLWFVILPGSLYVVALGVLAAFFAFFENAST